MQAGAAHSSDECSADPLVGFGRSSPGSGVLNHYVGCIKQHHPRIKTSVGQSSLVMV